MTWSRRWGRLVNTLLMTMLGRFLAVGLFWLLLPAALAPAVVYVVLGLFLGLWFDALGYGVLVLVERVAALLERRAWVPIPGRARRNAECRHLHCRASVASSSQLLPAPRPATEDEVPGSVAAPAARRRRLEHATEVPMSREVA